MEVQWIKCGSRFCPLETVNLTNVDYNGVYIIWHNTSAKVIYVGQGDIAERLKAHRMNPQILGHRGTGLLLATWAPINDAEMRRRVERYLHTFYEPLVSTCDNGPVEEVNLPGS